MSEIKVNKISPRSGTDVTLGDSGDTFTLPTGVTLDASNATTTLPDGTVTNAKVNASAAIDYSKLNLTGNIALADLSATGTKDATTFLRGDNTFASAGGNMTPAFFAFKSSSTNIGDVTTAKLSIDSEVFDTDSCYDNSTNYRFTPTTAGKYYVYAGMDLNLSSVSALVYSRLYIYKNGSEIAQANKDFRFDAYGTQTINNLTITVDMNGSSDYLEVYGFGDTTSNDNVFIAGSATSAKTYFGAYKIIT